MNKNKDKDSNKDEDDDSFEGMNNGSMTKEENLYFLKIVKILREAWKLEIENTKKQADISQKNNQDIKSMEQSVKENPRMLTRQEAADFLHISIRKFDTYIKEKQISVAHLDGSVRIAPESMHDFVKRKTTPAITDLPSTPKNKLEQIADDDIEEEEEEDGGITM